MSRSLRPLSVLTRPSNFSRPLTRSQHSLLRQSGDVKIQRVRLKSNFPRYGHMQPWDAFTAEMLTRVEGMRSGSSTR